MSHVAINGSAATRHEDSKYIGPNIQAEHWHRPLNSCSVRGPSYAAAGYSFANRRSDEPGTRPESTSKPSPPASTRSPSSGCSPVYMHCRPCYQSRRNIAQPGRGRTSRTRGGGHTGCRGWCRNSPRTKSNVRLAVFVRAAHGSLIIFCCMQLISHWVVSDVTAGATRKLRRKTTLLNQQCPLCPT